MSGTADTGAKPIASADHPSLSTKFMKALASRLLNASHTARSFASSLDETSPPPLTLVLAFSPDIFSSAAPASETAETSASAANGTIQRPSFMAYLLSVERPARCGSPRKSGRSWGPPHRTGGILYHV